MTEMMYAITMSSNSSKAPWFALPPDIPRCRLICDGVNCTETNPFYACAGCHAAYYCSRRCQKRSWESHKDDCKRISQKIQEIEASRNLGDAQSFIAKDGVVATKKIGDESICVICLKAIPINPIVAESCGHTICLSCSLSWQQRRHQKAAAAMSGSIPYFPFDDERNPSCPFCRADAHVVEQVFLNRAHGYIEQLSRHDLSPSDRDLFYQETLACLRTVDSVPALHYSILFLKALLYIAMNKAADALKAVEDLNAEHGRRREIQLKLARLSAHGQVAKFLGYEEHHDELFRYHDILHEQNSYDAVVLPPRFFPQNSRDVVFVYADAMLLQGFKLDDEVGIRNHLMAQEALQSLDIDELTGDQWVRYCVMLPRCAHDYELAIKMGKLMSFKSTPWQRVLYGDRRWYAESLWSKGELLEAFDAMIAGMLYVRPWDDTNRKADQKDLDDLIDQMEMLLPRR